MKPCVSLLFLLSFPRRGSIRIEEGRNTLGNPFFLLFFAAAVIGDPLMAAVLRLPSSSLCSIAT